MRGIMLTADICFSVKSPAGLPASRRAQNTFDRSYSGCRKYLCVTFAESNKGKGLDFQIYKEFLNEEDD